MNISIKQTKQIREQLNLRQIIIYGISYTGVKQISTHGKTVIDAKEAAEIGNKIKKEFGWPQAFCNSKPLERICEHCSYFQRGYHHPGDVIQSNMHGKCMFNPESIKRYEQDRACGQFEPAY